MAGGPARDTTRTYTAGDAGNEQSFAAAGKETVVEADSDRAKNLAGATQLKIDEANKAADIAEAGGEDKVQGQQNFRQQAEAATDATSQPAGQSASGLHDAADQLRKDVFSKDPAAATNRAL